MGTELTGLSFIVPAFNEEESILETLRELGAELTRLSIPFEIIVVDDGSTDRVDTTLGTGVADQVTIIRHPINAGYGAALKTGIKFAQYEWVGIVDADGSYEIGGLSRLVKQAELGFDMVVGRRENIRMTDSFIKGLMRKTLHIFVRVLVDHDMKDLNSGLSDHEASISLGVSAIPMFNFFIYH